MSLNSSQNLDIYYVSSSFFLNHMKSSDAKASKCHLKFSSLMMIKLAYLS